MSPPTRFQGVVTGSQIEKPFLDEDDPAEKWAKADARQSKHIKRNSLRSRVKTVMSNHHDALGEEDESDKHDDDHHDEEEEVDFVLVLFWKD